MGTVIDFASYRHTNCVQTTNDICNNFATPSSSSKQQPVWILNNEKIEINQDEDFAETYKIRKYAADPIKNIEDINRILDYFISNGQYRNLLLFTMGINFGLRCGDLLQLKFGHVLNKDYSFKNQITLVEEKNKNVRTCYLNQFVVDAVQTYVNSLADNRSEINLNDYLFTSLSNSNSFKYYDNLHCKSSTTGKPIKVRRDPSSSIQVKSVEKMLKKVINDELGINVHAGTHLMRKTFAYQVIMNAPDRNRAIEFLQRILGHKSPFTTLYYAGVTSEEQQQVCQNLYHGRIDFCGGIGLNNGKKVGGNM